MGQRIEHCGIMTWSLLSGVKHYVCRLLADDGPVLRSNRHSFEPSLLVNFNNLSRVNRVQTILTLIYFHLTH